MENRYQWIQFYEEFADRLLEYNDKRDELFNIMKKLSSEQKLLNYLHFERDDWWGGRNYQIDPFSVMGAMNRNIAKENRTVFAKIFAEIFNIKTPAPTEFDGIPTLNNMNSFFGGVDEIWDLFCIAIDVSKTGEFTSEFELAFDKAISVHGNGLAYITIGLFWIRPTVFISLDSKSKPYLSENYGIDIPRKNFNGKEYVDFLNSLKSKIAEKTPGIIFPEISYAALIGNSSAPPIIESKKTPPDEPDHPVDNPPSSKNRTDSGLPKNLILFGSPGTGKTYSSIIYAVAIIENKPYVDAKAEDYKAVFSRYLKYKEEGRVAFITFHQSFGYEEFIEGIRPVLVSEDEAEPEHEIEYEIHDGIFKTFCDKAGTPVGSNSNEDLGIGRNPSVWKVSLEGSGDNQMRNECFEKGHIRIGYDKYGEFLPESQYNFGGKNILNAFYYRMQIGDIVLSCYSNKTIDAIGVITGEPEWHNKYPHLKRVRKVKWLITNINEDIYELNSEKLMMQPTVYKMSISVTDILHLLKKLKPALFTKGVIIPNRVFIIDEINRGNISKIFGELITLIEPTKRIGASEELRVTLPYSGQKFGVPDNVYIIGTMNTADRSIAMIDAALRRRFKFIEMLPDSELLKDVFVEGIDIGKILDTLNKRITTLLDREHTIGHSYFLDLRDDPSIERLATIFENEIVPLLQEYFYDDYEKIQLVLGDNQKSDDNVRFIVKKTDAAELFGDADVEPEYYEINKAAFRKVGAYDFFR